VGHWIGQLSDTGVCVVGVEVVVVRGCYGDDVLTVDTGVWWATG
jgi:hypothetical protein